MLQKTRSAAKLFFWFALGKCLPAKHLFFPYYLGKLFGFLSFLFGGKPKKVVAGELHLIFPRKTSKQIGKVVRQSYIDFYTSRFEQFHFPHLNKENIGDLIVLEGADILDKALAKGKGVIALHPHFGSYLLIIPALGYNGYPVSQIALRGNAVSGGITPTKTEFNRFNWMAFQYRVRRFEDSLPGEFINIKHASNLRKVFQKLKANEIIAVSGTGRGGQRFAPAALCGREALLSTGPYEMCIHAGAALLPMFVVRSRGKTHSLIIKPPIEIHSDRGKSEVASAVQKFADYLTEYIYRYPHQFGLRFGRMKKRADWDDHPFFVDYARGETFRRHFR